ncbi:MAG: outer membrane protein assembly factor BamA [Chitinophagaceae bacterium]|nr:outer membrane protein assembly factor BamA [Oligoflexus sp.]
MRLEMLLLMSLASSPLLAGERIEEVVVRGNQKVEADAITTVLKSQKGHDLDPASIQADIKHLHELGYFSDIRFLKEPAGNGIRVIVEVVEKPAIGSIQFVGLSEMKEEDFKEKLETKVYQIVNETKINADLRMIEKQYLEKGFYLAKATYKLDPTPNNANEVSLVFNVEEGGKVLVGDVHIMGNAYFSSAELINQFYSKPYTRLSNISAPGSVYNDDFIKRDVEMLGFIYKDQGFAQVNVSNPVKIMEEDRRYVRLTLEVEEGIQYSIGGIEFSGDLLYTPDEMKGWMLLKPNALFRFGNFRKDVEMLVDKYGDKGYAFADVNPKVRYDKEKKLVYLNYEITKGEKVYFGDFTFIGNTKTRDNVLRRELEVADSELYSGTRLTKSKSNMERLGYFEEVQTLRERDEKNHQILNYKIKVKEKPTGQLQAAMGFSPSAEGNQNKWFGQGKYSEENQSGRGWRTSLTGRWNGGKNYSLEVGWTDPRLNDSDWSLGFSAFVRNEVRLVTNTVTVQEERKGGSVTIGRRIVELIRASITYRYSKINVASDTALVGSFVEAGDESSIILGLARNATNNYIDPSDGSDVRINQEFTGGPLGGTRKYLETTFNSAYFQPVDFSDTYRTYFRFAADFGLLWQNGNERIPILTRFRLGGPEDLRGYELRTIGPKSSILQTPTGQPQQINWGGTKKVLLQAEYFMPIIKEANIKGLLFYDMGRAYAEDETVNFASFERDAGFGFRWITPVAPFRFEWAYPIENGRVGNLRFIFYLGY